MAVEQDVDAPEFAIRRFVVVGVGSSLFTAAFDFDVIDGNLQRAPGYIDDRLFDVLGAQLQ